MPGAEPPPEGFSARGGVQPCPLRRAWIELELVGEDDRPIADARYVVVLPDGAERRGKTNARGRCRIEGIPAGTCDVCFPDLDRDAHAYLESVEVPEPA